MSQATRLCVQRLYQSGFTMVLDRKTPIRHRYDLRLVRRSFLHNVYTHINTNPDPQRMSALHTRMLQNASYNKQTTLMMHWARARKTHVQRSALGDSQMHAASRTQ